jgi:hypothetical protein
VHVCHPDAEERKRRLKLLQQGGVITQHEDGSLQAVSPEEAKKHIAAMEPERRALYETSHPEDYDAKQYSCLRHHSQYGKETATLIPVPNSNYDPNAIEPEKQENSK